MPASTYAHPTPATAAERLCRALGSPGHSHCCGRAPPGLGVALAPAARDPRAACPYKRPAAAAAAPAAAAGGAARAALVGLARRRRVRRAGLSSRGLMPGCPALAPHPTPPPLSGILSEPPTRLQLLRRSATLPLAPCGSLRCRTHSPFHSHIICPHTAPSGCSAALLKPLPSQTFVRWTRIDASAASKPPLYTRPLLPAAPAERAPLQAQLPPLSLHLPALLPPPAPAFDPGAAAAFTAAPRRPPPFAPQRPCNMKSLLSYEAGRQAGRGVVGTRNQARQALQAGRACPSKQPGGRAGSRPGQESRGRALWGARGWACLPAAAWQTRAERRAPGRTRSSGQFRSRSCPPFRTCSRATRWQRIVWRRGEEGLVGEGLLQQLCEGSAVSSRICD